MLSNDSVLVVSKNCTWRELQGNIVILQSDARPPVTHELNSTSSFVWSCLQKEKLPFKDLLEAYLEEFDVESEIAHSDLMSLITQLTQKNLLWIEN